MFLKAPDDADLHTNRLVLVALTPELARTALEDRGGFGRAVGARVPEVWPMADFGRMLPRMAAGHEEGSTAGPTRLILHDGTLVGETGFHGPPDRSGTVEVGYGILPDYRGLGIATEATRALIEHAFASPPRKSVRRTSTLLRGGSTQPGGVRRVVARCLPDNPASLKVLTKLGMRRVGTSGEAILFELVRQS